MIHQLMRETYGPSHQKGAPVTMCDSTPRLRPAGPHGLAATERTIAELIEDIRTITTDLGNSGMLSTSGPLLALRTVAAELPAAITAEVQRQTKNVAAPCAYCLDANTLQALRMNAQMGEDHARRLLPVTETLGHHPEIASHISWSRVDDDVSAACNAFTSITAKLPALRIEDDIPF